MTSKYAFVMLLRKSDGAKRVHPSDFIYAWRSKKQRVETGGGRKARFWLVPKSNSPTLPESIGAALLKGETLEVAMAQCPDVDANEFHFIDQMIDRTRLGSGVTEGYCYQNKATTRTVPPAPTRDGVSESEAAQASAIGAQASARGAHASAGGAHASSSGAQAGSSGAQPAQAAPDGRVLKRERSDADGPAKRLRDTFITLKQKLDVAASLGRWHSDDPLDTDTVESWGMQVVSTILEHVHMEC